MSKTIIPDCKCCQPCQYCGGKCELHRFDCLSNIDNPSEQQKRLIEEGKCCHGIRVHRNCSKFPTGVKYAGDSVIYSVLELKTDDLPNENDDENVFKKKIQYIGYYAIKIIDEKGEPYKLDYADIWQTAVCIVTVCFDRGYTKKKTMDWVGFELLQKETTPKVEKS
jgi:hypothetical protein